jgi:4-amino-4-deoxy-L-arabinose transferase-like glycosyltransferase
MGTQDNRFRPAFRTPVFPSQQKTAVGREILALYTMTLVVSSASMDVSRRLFMSHRGWHWLLLAAVGCVLFLTNLGATRLWDVDEAIFSQASVEMLDRGDWVTPYFNGELFAHKPPVMYWCQIAAYKVFGTTEFAARLFSALFSIGTLIVTYELGRALFNQRAGLWAGIALGSCVNFALIARAATPDAYLTFFCTLALLVHVKGTGRGVSPWQPALPPTWRVYALAYAVMGIAVLVKGPVGVVLPTAVWGMFLLVAQRWQDSEQARPLNGIMGMLRWFAPLYFLRTVWRMRPLTAIAMVLLVAGPWYAWVGIRTHGEFLREFFFVHNIGRAANAMEHHGGPFYYYLVAICIGTFPWCVLLGPAINHLIQNIKSAAPARAAYVLLVCWAAVWIGCFSLVGTKLPSYVIPAYPALALMFAALVEGWLAQTTTVDCRRWLRAAWSVTGIVGVAILVAVPIVTRKYLAGEWTPALVGLIPLSGAVVGLWLAERGQQRQSLIVLAVVGILFCTGLLGIAVLPIDAHQNSQMFTELMRQQSAEKPHLAAFKYSPPSLVFYGRQPLAKLDSVDDIVTFFRTHPDDAFLITLDKNYEQIVPRLPSDITILKQDRRFLKPGNIVLLGRANSDLAQRPAESSPR